jgi:DNA-binding HxlR family transcriptional regulator
MRTYNQHCGLAKALDLVGDRWTLLIVRELLIRDACRYTDLRNGLPGIATNLLAERLGEMEEAGLVLRREAPPPIATTLFQLTQRGRELEPAVLELGRWGAPLLAKSPADHALLAHWLVLPLKLHLADAKPDDPPIVIELRAESERIVVSASAGAIDVSLGEAERPTTVVTGKPEAILKLFTGRLDIAKASGAGIKIEGVKATLQRVIPKRSV